MADKGVVIGAVVGVGVLGYGLYKWMQSKQVEVPTDYSFSDLVIAGVSPTTAYENDTVTVTGSFKYKGPSHKFRVIVNIGHDPFTNLFEATDYKDYTLGPVSDWKSYSYSVPVHLNSYISAIGSPYDIWVRIYDIDAQHATGTEKIGDAMLTILTTTYYAHFDVSPVGAGYYTIGGTYGQESGEIDNSSNVEYINIDVQAREGYIFSHWETDGELLYDPTQKYNAIKNDGSSFTAVFVSDTSGPIATFLIQPNYYDGWIYYMDNPQGYDAILVNQSGAWGQQILLQNNKNYYFSARKNPYSAEKVLDHWVINGINMGNQNPIGLYISGPVSITAVMKSP